MQTDPVSRARHEDGRDRFLAFWLVLLTSGRRSVTTSSAQQVHDEINRFFSDDLVHAAIELAGQDAVADELRDAAAEWFRLGLTDPQYSSGIFGFGRLSADKLRQKSTNDAAATLALLAAASDDNDIEFNNYVRLLSDALTGSIHDVFGDPGSIDLAKSARRWGIEIAF